jgi:hypothetical protein
MSHRITFTVPDSFYQCAVKEARKQGRDTGNNSGVGSLAKGALRAYLNRNGYSVGELDRRDGEGLPAGRRTYDDAPDYPITGGVSE